MNFQRTRLWTVVAVVLIIATGCNREKMTELHRVKSGMLEVVLLSPHEGLRHGKDNFIIEFRSPSGALVDVGSVRASASMSMSGTPMIGTVDVARSDAPGRYSATSDFSMAGTWRTTIQWNGSAGQGSVTFSGSVQ